MPGIIESLFGGGSKGTPLEKLRAAFSPTSTAGKVSGDLKAKFMKYQEETTDDPPLQYEDWLKTQKGGV